MVRRLNGLKYLEPMAQEVKRYVAAKTHQRTELSDEEAATLSALLRSQAITLTFDRLARRTGYDRSKVQRLVKSLREKGLMEPTELRTSIELIENRVKQLHEGVDIDDDRSFRSKMLPPSPVTALHRPVAADFYTEVEKRSKNCDAGTVLLYIPKAVEIDIDRQIDVICHMDQLKNIQFRIMAHQSIVENEKFVELFKEHFFEQVQSCGGFDSFKRDCIKALEYDFFTSLLIFVPINWERLSTTLKDDSFDPTAYTDSLVVIGALANTYAKSEAKAVGILDPWITSWFVRLYLQNWRIGSNHDAHRFKLMEKKTKN